MVVGAGRVVLSDDLERMEKNDESQGTRGSAAGSRQGSAGPRRAAGEAARLGGLDEQVVRLAGLEDLWKAYPTSIMEGDHGLWITVTSKPLGNDGPQAIFVVACPHGAKYEPRAWAFWKLGDFPKFIGPRHTNFPDASICAFGPQDGAWERSDGLVPLIDLYSTWVARQLYLQHFERWPGRQHGASALYRRTEFRPEEWCGCGSDLRYANCHQPADESLSDDDAAEEHRRIFGSDYGPRSVPKSVKKFVRSAFRKVPAFKDAYECR